MRTFVATIATALAIGVAAPPLAAIADSSTDPAASDAMASQSPQAYSSFITRPCATRHSVNCYWDAIEETGRDGWSYWSIRVGNKVCIRYWDAAYNRKHGHCTSRRG
jgi:hypothetical protein